MRIELDPSTQVNLILPNNDKVKVWYNVNQDDSYSIGLDVRHGKSHTYATLSEKEALNLASVLMNYALTIGEFNKDSEKE